MYVLDLEELLGEHSISIFPNPTQGLLNIAIDGPSNAAFDLSVVSPQGQQVLNRQINVAGSLNTQVDLSEMASGIYYVRIANDNGVRVAKVVVQ